MEEIAELVGVTPAEVRGTATFYDMLHTEPVGTLRGGGLHQHRLPARRRRRAARARRGARSGVGAGGTTADGVFTLEEAECLADCDRAPCVQVNHRYVGAPDPRDASTRWSTTCAPGALAEDRARRTAP